MNTKPIEIIQDITELQANWNATIKLSNLDNVFVTYEWLTCWLKVYAPNKKQFIICIKENESVIALAPLIILSVKELGLPFRRLQFIGYESCDYMDFIIHKEHPECLGLIFDCIQENKKKWDYCELHDISGGSKNLLHINKILGEKKQLFKVFKDNICPYILLDSSVDAFLNNRTGKFRYQLRRAVTMLEKFGNLSYEKILDKNQALQELPLFLDMLLMRERIVNRITNSKNIDNRSEIFKQYIENENMWPNIDFSKLCIDNKAIAYHFGFKYNKKACWYAPTFDINYIEPAPGKLLVKYSIEYAITNNYKEFDFLRGGEMYKFDWTKEYRDNFCLFMSNNKLISKFLFYWLLIIKPAFRKAKQSLKILKKKAF